MSSYYGAGQQYGQQDSGMYGNYGGSPGTAEYNEQHGGKWSIDLMRMYLEATRGQQIADQLLEEIENVIVTSLRAVQGVMINDKHCFEMYAGL